MLINVGMGTLLAALGATPVSILPPIMLALGYSPFTSIALPALGYDSLCTYALLGVPVVVFADMVGKVSSQSPAPAEINLYFAQYTPVITTIIGLAMLRLAGGWGEVKRGWFPALLSGLTAGSIAIGMNFAGVPTLTGIAAGMGVALMMLLYVKLSGRRLMDRRPLDEADIQAEQRMALWRAALPWILLVLFSVATNYGSLGLYDILFNKLAMPLYIVPGKPEKLRMLWQAYTWVLIATLAAIPFYRMGRAQIDRTLRKTLRRVPRPAFATAVFFAIGYILNYSGMIPSRSGTAIWEASPDGANMIKVLADSSAAVFHEAYAGIAAFLGLLGGFISGSEASSIAMMTKLHFETVAQVFASEDPARVEKIALLVGAVSGIGAGLASVISPAKLQNAAAVIDCIGLEGKVIRATVVIAAMMTCIAALMTFAFLAWM
jgi:lactate permease